MTQRKMAGATGAASQWLAAIGLALCAELFEQHAIELYLRPDLTRDLLLGVSITVVGHRLSIPRPLILQRR
jgi:hypothetical protein